MSSLNRSRRTLLIVLVAFLLPVIVAWVVLNQHWYQAGTNKGTLIANPVSLQEATDLPDGWKLAYLAPASCEQRCQNAIFVMNQVDVAVGKDSDRLTPIVLSESKGPSAEQYSNQFDIQTMVAPKLIDTLSELPEASLFIIDPLNNVMLYYPTHTDKEAMILEGKNVLADIRKLLKLSRIG
ncbi:hypothetical protein [Idiomarina seosinensis]|uniref:Cytochrome oxidase n=1 Tax=Idiomarina seosinensis TaxID=281739 RepID=A0A432ZDQ4_9GAMM|nr:hypothetical protein [Idiomarina seosinensis]RUO76029.1 hypothetical protein CWI81_07875 [Idiomarina seosinensis]